MAIIETLGIQHPIIQAPMAGVTTPEFVTACCEAGVLGSIGAGYLSAEEIRVAIRSVKRMTDRPFAVNLFIPDNNQFDQDLLRRAYEALQPVGEQLGLPFWKTPLSETDFIGQVNVIAEEKPAVCSFTFGLPSLEVVHQLKGAGIVLIGTATTAEEAKAVEELGLDMVVVQGAEAGGHRGSFSPDGPLIPLADLMKETAAAIQLPIIAAGGIANRTRMDELLAAGATAVQVGTALLAAEESGAAPAYKQAVLNASADSTVITDVFSGRPARGIRNRFIDQLTRAPIAPYPYQNDLTKRLRKEAAAQGNAEFLSLWAGTAVHQTKEGTVSSLVNRFLDDKL